MKIYYVLWIPIGFLILDCSHTHRMGLTDIEHYYGGINQKCEGREGKIQAFGNREISGRNIYVTQDSIRWIDPETGSVHALPTSDVTSVEIKRGGRGALEGMGIGFLSGATIGAFGGFASGDDPPGWFSMTAEQKAAGGGLVLGLSGAIIGLPVGALVGSKDIFILSNPARPLTDSRWLTDGYFQQNKPEIHQPDSNLHFDRKNIEKIEGKQMK